MTERANFRPRTVHLSQKPNNRRPSNHFVNYPHYVITRADTAQEDILMIKYMLAAGALKAFSTNAWTRKIYRQLGNKLGNRSRNKGIPAHYIQRAHENLLKIETYGKIRDGMQLVELGTGWAHWEAVFTRLFYDVNFILFDVWDNRQFSGFHRYCSDLRRRLRTEVDRPAAQIDRAELILDQLINLNSFDEVYDLLGFKYVINDKGSLSAIDSGLIDLVISSDVLEHVHVNSIDTLMQDMFRILRSGGASSHQIVPYDHLAIYDRAVNGKNYIKYSDWAWKTFFENEVQYFNRVQQSEWIEKFSEHGFKILYEQITGRDDVSKIKISDRFSSYSNDDLESTVTHIIAVK